MANIKFSAFTQKVVQTNVDFLVGYTGADNVRITPAALGDGIYLPLGGGTMTGNLKLNDGVRLEFGNGADGEFYHDGSDLYMTNGTGDMYLINKADDKDIIFQTDDGSGGYETYFYLDGSAGGTAPQTVFPNNAQLVLGSTENFILKSNGSNSYIENYIGDLVVTNYANDKDIQFSSDDGAGGTTLYYYLDGSIVRNRFPKNVYLEDDVKLLFGDASTPDLEIYHDGSNSYISDTGTGSLKVGAANWHLMDSALTSYMMTATPGAECNLYYNGSGKFITTSTGIQVTDEVSIGTNLVHTGDTDTKLAFGTNNISLIAGGSTHFIAESDQTTHLYSGNATALVCDVSQNVSIQAAKNLYLDGGSDTYITESSDGVIDFYGDTKLLLTLKQNGTQSEVVVNEGSFDCDFRVESNNDTHLLFAEAEAAGKVGILTNVPFSVLSINSNGVPIFTAANMAETGLTIHNGVTGTAIQIGTYDAGSYNYIQSGYINSASTARELRFYNGNVNSLKLSTTGAATFSGSITANAGITVDGLYIDNNTIAHSGGDITLDASGDIILDAAGDLQVVGIVEYADNAAALAAGLTAGAFYRTGDLLKVVH